jgi:C4-dicarboxylate transporter DctM subunit
MGGIYGGVFTPTEAAAVAAVYAFLIALFVYRDMGPLARRSGDSLIQGSVRALLYLPYAMVHRDTRHVLVEAGRTTIMLMFIIANAMLFAHVLTTERIPHAITEWIIQTGFEPWSFLIVVNILLLIAGNFMEPSAILLIMAPILFPIALELGIDPIHLGIIMVVNMEIGMITPPVGLNLFVTSGITGMSILEVVKAALPWLCILLVFLVLVTYVPIISTFLPDLLYGPQIR